MSSKSLHLVERAAERLRDAGTADPTAALLLGTGRGAALGGGVRPDAVSQGEDIDGTDAAVARPPAIGTALLEQAGMIDWGKVRTRVAEEFRIVQGQVLRAAFASDATSTGLSNLVMVTSARPGEGKSFAAFNLAASIARQNDHDVLLVDADSKADSLGRRLGLTDERGLLDLAADTGLDPDKVIVRTEIEKLSVLPLGRSVEHSPDLFSTRHMARLVRELGRRYGDRLVVIDAPPCLSSSDPATLAPIVGQIVFVIEADRTQRAEVEGSLDLIQACPNISLLLNKVQMTTPNTFGSYAAYYSNYPA